MCIDLKSFYASVECRERGLDPLDTNLVVADESRTDKTICLAVSPSLKSYGLSGRCRLFEAKQKVKEVNYQRRKNNNYKPFIGKSYIASELNNNKSLQLKLVKEDDSYTDYYAMTCGFKNKKELMKYTKAVIKLANKVK